MQSTPIFTKKFYLSKTKASHKLPMAQLALTRTTMLFSFLCSNIDFVMSDTNKGSSRKEGNNTNTPKALHAAALTLASVSVEREYNKVTANR